jgi:hypothetical protein
LYSFTFTILPIASTCTQRFLIFHIYMMHAHNAKNKSHQSWWLRNWNSQLWKWNQPHFSSCVYKKLSVLDRIENLSAVVVLLVEFFWNMVLGFWVSQKPL